MQLRISKKDIWINFLETRDLLLLFSTEDQNMGGNTTISTLGATISAQLSHYLTRKTVIVSVALLWPLGNLPLAITNQTPMLSYSIWHLPVISLPCKEVYSLALTMALVSEDKANTVSWLQLINHSTEKGSVHHIQITLGITLARIKTGWICWLTRRTIFSRSQR